jgi:indole-3-glycerol phosphate synthase
MDESAAVAPAVQSILVAARERPGGTERVSVDARPLADAFERALAGGRTPLIAEVKPTSPTTDGRRADDPVALAEAMVDGGAAALSVLTEPEHFGGSPEHLRRVREAVEVPVLRKDFVLTEAQLDTVAADLVLLIARFVDDLPALTAAAQERGFQVVIETHTRAEVEAAVEAGADVIGINNRDLAALEVDLGTFERVAPAVPSDGTLIAESGIGTRADVERMRGAGADGLLVGSAIMDGGVTQNTRRLTGATEPTS